MAFESNNRTIYDLLNDTCFIVPLNQRKYVWKEINWNELWEDIELVKNKKIKKHFLGSIVLKNENEKRGIKNNYSVIDGQQRIMTLSIILAAAGLVYLEKGNYDKLRGLDKHLTLVDTDGNHFPLIDKEANPIINEIIVKIHTALIEKRRLTIDNFVTKSNPLEIKCFLFFYNKLNEETSLDRIVEIVTDIGYIEIIANSDEDAYSIFEVLNARGQELGDFDLLRNYILKCSKNKKAITNKLKKIESRLGSNVEIFLSHYVKHKYGKTCKKKTSRPYKELVKELNGKDINEFVDDLCLKSSYYERIINPTDSSLKEYSIFKFFKSRRQQQLRPVIIGLMHQLDLKNISQEVYEIAIENLYRFFICYFIIGKEKSNKIDDIVDGYSYTIENKFEKHKTITKFMTSIYSRVPSKKNFTDNLKTIRYSNKFEAYSGSKIKTNVTAILEIIESIKGTDLNLINEEYNIEHCNPDSDSIDNSVLGNLVLLERRINDKNKNKDLCDKSCRYVESRFTLPKEVAEEVSNGSFDMELRAEMYSDILYGFISEINVN